jgi:hypothetical protein
LSIVSVWVAILRIIIQLAMVRSHTPPRCLEVACGIHARPY